MALNGLFSYRNRLTQNGKHSVECYTAMEIAELRRRQPEKAIEYVRRAIDLSQQASTQHSVASTGELLIAQIFKEQGTFELNSFFTCVA